MSHALRYAANCSMLFTELPLLERPAAAKEAGFSAIEFWWPWPDQPVPPDSAVDEFVGAIRDADIPLIGLNFFAGDLAGPDCGVLSVPARSSEFRDNIDVVAGIGEALGVAAHNALVRQPDRRGAAGAAGRTGHREPDPGGRGDRRLFGDRCWWNRSAGPSRTRCGPLIR